MSDRYDVRDEGDRILVRWQDPRWMWWSTAVLVLAVVGVVVVSVLRDGAGSLSYLLVPMALLALQTAWWSTLRHVVMVDAFGVDKPRRGRRYGWAEVSYIEKPGPFHDVVILGLVEGGSARTMFPARLSTRFAELGRVPIRD